MFGHQQSWAKRGREDISTRGGKSPKDDPGELRSKGGKKAERRNCKNR